LSSEEFNIFHELHSSELSSRCYGWKGFKKVIAAPRIFENIQSGGKKMPINATIPLFSKTVSLKFKVKDIKNLKQVKIKWNYNVI